MRGRVAIAAIALGALLVAWSIRFGCDDAFISFNYSRSLVNGDGLTWFGEHVEGYTNFSWVLWIAGGIALGIDPLAWAWVGSLGAMVLVLVTTYRWARVRSNQLAAALCAAGILATNFTFVAFGTSGLETMLQCALLTTATFEIDRMRRGDGTRPFQLSLISFLGGLALWTRLDSAVVLLVVGVAAVAHLIRTRAPALLYASLLGPGAFLVCGWLAWKLHYYGEVLPNTFHAKVAVSSDTLGAATRFVRAFLHAYMLWPFLALAAVVALVRRRFAMWLPAAILASWYAYVIFVGGDFMEFRFFVPTMPMLAIVIAHTVTLESSHASLPRPAMRSAVTVTVLAAVSWRHAATFDRVPDRFFDSVQALGSYYGMVADDDWEPLGGALRETLAGSGASLACNGAGAIPYYSELPTVDQLGLNDRWVARHGARPPGSFLRPGHQRFATYDYLVSRRVTFIIGSPTLIRRGGLRQSGANPTVSTWMRFVLGYQVAPLDRMRVVAVPVGNRGEMLMWYLTEEPHITERIRAAGWDIRDFVLR